MLTGKIDLYEDDDLRDNECMYNVLWSDLHSEKEINERKNLRVIEELSDDESRLLLLSCFSILLFLYVFFIIIIIIDNVIEFLFY